MSIDHPVWLFILCALAVWRVTHLLAAEDGPWDLIAHLRKGLGDGVLGRLFDCFYCLSLWVALPPAIGLGSGWIERPLYWLALSGVACLVERISVAREKAIPAIQFLEGDNICAAAKNER
jgi:hypothetical protein